MSIERDAFLCGAAVGAAAMYFADPQSGRGRRAAARKAVAGWAAEFVSTFARDLRRPPDTPRDAAARAGGASVQPVAEAGTPHRARARGGPAGDPVTAGTALAFACGATAGAAVVYFAESKSGPRRRAGLLWRSGLTGAVARRTAVVGVQTRREGKAVALGL